MFCYLHSKMSRNMCKLHQQVRNGQNLPNKSLNFKNFFFLSNFTDNLDHVQVHASCFLLYPPGCLGTCVFGVTNYVMPKRALVQPLHG